MRYLKKIMAGFLMLALVLFIKLLPMDYNLETVYAATGFTVNDCVLTVDVNAAASPRDAIENALSYAHSNSQDGRIYTVKVPEGTYDLKSTLHIYENTTLDVRGVTFNYTKASGNMIMLGSPENNKNVSTMGGYGTIKNITILGGTWKGNNSNTSSLFRMAHASNVLFEGCVLDGGGCSHQMEIAAIDGFIVKNCTFKDMASTDKTGKREALQFDIPCSEYVFSGIILDGTPMKNVTVTGCTFENVPRGLGTHNMLVGRYHTGITITDNTFKNVDGECIVCLNYRDCNISNNKITNCGAGILFEYFRPLESADSDVKAIYTTIYDGKETVNASNEPDAASKISGNTITLTDDRYADEYVGIRVYGYNLEADKQATGNGSSDIIPARDYYISNVSVTNNTIKTNGYGIHLSNVRDSKVTGNKITNIDECSWEDGILVEAQSTGISIQNNELKNITRYGICLDNFSKASSIYKNTVSGSYYGIFLNDNSGVTGNIENNTIKNSTDTGILLNEVCSAKNITGNTVTSSGWHGLSLYDGCSVSGSITENKISKSEQNGIFLNKYSTAKTVSKNTLTENQGYAIALYDGSQVNGSITSNTIKKNKTHAIQLNKDCVVDKIRSNYISDTKGKGICIRDGSTVWSEISKNKIYTTSQEGIYINSNENAFSICSNSLKKCSRTSIVIDTSSKKKITIQKNTFSAKKPEKKLLVRKGTVKSDIKKTDKKKK